MGRICGSHPGKDLAGGPRISYWDDRSMLRFMFPSCVGIVCMGMCSHVYVFVSVDYVFLCVCTCICADSVYPNSLCMWKSEVNSTGYLSAILHILVETVFSLNQDSPGLVYQA